MAKLTQKQLENWNAKLSNGFTFDVQRFLVWNDKQIQKAVELPDGRMLRATIGWYDVVEKFRTVGSTPKLNLSIWQKSGTGEAWISHGLGYTEDLTPEVFTRRNYSVIAELSKRFNDSDLLERMNQHMGALENACII